MIRKHLHISVFFILLASCGNAFGQLKSDSLKKDKLRVEADSIITQSSSVAKEAFTNLREEAAMKLQRADTLPTFDGNRFKELQKIDSIGVSYENGQLKLPDQLPKNLDKETAEKMVREKLDELKKINSEKPSLALPEKSSIPDIDAIKEKSLKKLDDKIPAEKAREYENKFRRVSDSISQVVKRAERIVEEKSWLSAHKVYSEKALKKLYDSLGVSKLDSVLALLPNKKEVSKEDLLNAINFEMPTAPPVSESMGPKDLLNKEEITSLKDEISGPDLSTMKLPQEMLSELPPMEGFEFPSDKFRMMDSLRQEYLSKQKLSLNEQEIKDGVARAVAKKKPKFWDKTYFEGILSYLKYQETDFLQISPSLGFHLTKNFSLGLGPNILLKEENKNWSVFVGYRSFAKMELFSQRGYLQVEDIVDPGGLSTEYLKDMNHSILAGGGVLLPISRLLSINFSVLYRVNNEQYSGNQISPWVFRVGLSSIKSGKNKTL